MPDHDKYISTPEFNKLTEDYFDSRLKEANLTNKSDTADFKKKKIFKEKKRKIEKHNNKVTSARTEHVTAEEKLTDYITS